MDIKNLQQDISLALSSLVVEFSLIDFSKISEIIMGTNSINIKITLGFYPTEAYKIKIRNQIISILKLSLPADILDILKIEFKTQVKHHNSNKKIPAKKGIKNLILIGSGKGGVGKSVVCANLARSLAILGARVGIIDSDIYGPSIAKVFGDESKVKINDADKFIPKESIVENAAHKIQFISMGNLIEDHSALIFRAPMVTSAINQMIESTQWGQLDYLLIDSPPGTGDIQLSLIQNSPIAASLIVTTPQDLAVLDVKKFSEMLKKLQVPSLGIVENMSYYICQNCNSCQKIFNNNKFKALAEEIGVEKLANIPLDLNISKASDLGDNFIKKHAYLSDIYSELALKVGGKVAGLPKDFSNLLEGIKTINP